jgi:glycosyltransferase involved in cell wall biosynthesis
MQSSGQKRIIISVISDLVTDQRVNRAATSLHNSGMEVILVGRKLRKSLPLNNRPYRTKRFHLWFEKGPLFYAAYNIRLFLFLLFNKADIYLSNDLDTLAANFIISKFRNVPLVYDSHEYFTEVPELANRPFIKSVWLSIEKLIFPGLKHVMTVNDSIAKIYSEKYKVHVNVIRNLPASGDFSKPKALRKEWGIPEDKKVFLFQGAGINIDRGAEESIEAISLVDGAVLLFIGGGDVIDQSKKNVAERGLNQKVFFIPKQPMNELFRFTRMADFGLTLDKDSNLNYRFSLPNKIFDYIQANLPILATNLIEVKGIVEKYDIGMITSTYDPQAIAIKMKEMMSDEMRIAQWKKNLNIAASDLCWENEEQKFLEIFLHVGRT